MVDWFKNKKKITEKDKAMTELHNSLDELLQAMQGRPPQSQTIKLEAASNDPKEMENMALNQLRQRWEIVDVDTHSIFPQTTRQEVARRMENRFVGIDEEDTRLMYRFIDGEAHSLHASNWLQVAAYELERLFNDDN